jgi:hypothetical protein
MEQERHRPLTEAEERKLETDTHSLRVSWCKLALNLLKQRRHYFGLVSLTTPDSDGLAFALSCAADALISFSD